MAYCMYHKLCDNGPRKPGLYDTLRINIYRFIILCVGGLVPQTLI